MGSLVANHSFSQENRRILLSCWGLGDVFSLTHDPFESLDEQGVGQLIKLAIKKARRKNPKIKIGICGEHGGDASSIQFFGNNRFDYVSCSPFRIPIAKMMSAKFHLGVIDSNNKL